MIVLKPSKPLITLAMTSVADQRKPGLKAQSGREAGEEPLGPQVLLPEERRDPAPSRRRQGGPRPGESGADQARPPRGLCGTPGGPGWRRFTGLSVWVAPCRAHTLLSGNSRAQWAGPRGLPAPPPPGRASHPGAEGPQRWARTPPGARGGEAPGTFAAPRWRGRVGWGGPAGPPRRLPAPLAPSTHTRSRRSPVDSLIGALQSPQRIMVTAERAHPVEAAVAAGRRPHASNSPRRSRRCCPAPACAPGPRRKRGRRRLVVPGRGAFFLLLLNLVLVGLRVTLSIEN